MNGLIPHDSMNYFFDLPDDLQETIVMYDHEARMKDVLESLKSIKHIYRSVDFHEINWDECCDKTKRIKNRYQWALSTSVSYFISSYPKHHSVRFVQCSKFGGDYHIPPLWSGTMKNSLSDDLLDKLKRDAKSKKALLQSCAENGITKGLKSKTRVQLVKILLSI